MRVHSSEISARVTSSQYSPWLTDPNNSFMCLRLFAEYAGICFRIRWCNDGNEGEVLRDLLDRYEADNPGVSIEIGTVPYSAILENLPLDLAAGEGPDMARVTNLGGLAQY